MSGTAKRGRPGSNLKRRHGPAGLKLLARPRRWLGLRRRGFSGDALTEIKFLYKALFMGGGGENPRALAAKIAHTPKCPKTPEGLRFLEFFAEGERGFVRSRSRAKDQH